MKKMNKNIKPNRQIIEEAATWAEELDHGNLSPQQCKALAAWLVKSPVHVSELLMASTIIEAWGEVDPEKSVSIPELLRQSAPEVLTLLPQTAFLQESRQQTFGLVAWVPPAKWYSLKDWSARAIPATLLLLGLIISGLFILLTANPAPPPNGAALAYATVTGEQRSIPLEDGSIVHLNTESNIRIQFEDGARNINLISGEAMFEVAHDPARPFRVFVGDTIAEAIGTTFNVYRKASETTVSVIEGKVKVAVSGSINPLHQQEERPEESLGNPYVGSATTQMQPMAKPAKPTAAMTLISGDRAAVLSDGKIKTSRVANMATVTSWRMRRLVFERETLENIVQEYNRYNSLHIHIDDTALAKTRFTGVFAADDPHALITFLKVTAGVEVESRTKNDIRLHAAKGAPHL